MSSTATPQAAPEQVAWSHERQVAYNAACLRFYRACNASPVDEAEKQAALDEARRMEAEGGLL